MKPSDAIPAKIDQSAVRSLRHTLLFSLLLLALLALQPTTRAAAPSAWDPRLDTLGITLEPAASCAEGCWRLVEARYEDPDEAQGLHHVWARTQDGEGTLLAGEPWRVAWPDGEQALLTKPSPEWADFPLFSCYFPENGPGPYRAYMGQDEQRSDVVKGMGLPACYHVSFRLTWQWQVEAPTLLFLPLLQQ